MANMAVTDYLHWVKIVVKDERFNDVETIVWKDLPWATRTKFNWYFKYRAALITVKNPRYKVEMFWGNYLAISKEAKEAKDRRNKIAGKKATITKWKNKVELYKNNYTEIFPIETDKRYLSATCRIAREEAELKQLENDNIQK